MSKGNHDVLIPRWAIEFILLNASFRDEGRINEEYRSGKMIDAQEAIEKALKDDEERVLRLDNSK
jgi:hypothetical protein